MKIGLDIDGVIYPWHYNLVRYFREFKGYEGDDVEFWNMFESLSSETQNYYVSLPILYSGSSLTEDAKENLPKLASLGEIYYITSRIPELEYTTLKFFDEQEVPFKENLIFERRKSMVIRRYGIDYYVDDQAKYLEEMKGITSSFLFLQPHNKRGDSRGRFNCIGSLKKLYDIILYDQVKGIL